MIENRLFNEQKENLPPFNMLDIFNIKNKENFEPLIHAEIGFRDRLERRGEWNDGELIRARILGLEGMIKEPFIPEVRPLIFQEANIKPIFDPILQRKIAQVIPQIEIYPGHVDGLANFISREQQRDSQGRLRYLLTSGLAVEVITGVCRHHHDMDLVLFDFRNRWWMQYATDNVTADRYWAEMKFEPEFLEETAWDAQFQSNGSAHKVSTVHPGIILVQKLSNAWGRPPRERDFKDVVELIKFWQNFLNSDPSWNSVVEAAIIALPQTEQARTRERLIQYHIPKPVVPQPVPRRKLGLVGKFGF